LWGGLSPLLLLVLLLLLLVLVLMVLQLPGQVLRRSSLRMRPAHRPWRPELLPPPMTPTRTRGGGPGGSKGPAARRGRAVSALPSSRPPPPTMTAGLRPPRARRA